MLALLRCWVATRWCGLSRLFRTLKVKELTMVPSKHGLAATLLAGASFVAGATDANPLVAEQWRTRPLLVVAPSAQHPLITSVQAQLRQAEWRDAFQERDMVLFTVIGGEGRRDGQPLSEDQTRGLLQAVKLKAGSSAAVFLIGKDGGIKRTEYADHVALVSLFALIDTMPMRQR
jgi:hypothetical protein